MMGQPVAALRRAAGRVVGATLGDGTSVEAEVVVNAAGAWAVGVAAMAGCRVPARLSKGVMVAVAGRLVHAVVSRCRLPADGDILVPLGGSTIMGTTDAPVTDPDDAVADGAAIGAMLAAGEVRRVPDGAGRRVRHRPRKVPGRREAAGAGVEALDRRAGPARCRAADDEDLVADRDGPGVGERGGKGAGHLREPGGDVVAL